MATARFPVEAGHVLTFARAIGDASAAYSDAEFVRTGLVGAVVPPTFVQASAQFDPDYPLRPRPGAPWPAATPDGNSGPREDIAAAGPPLHAEQRYEFVRPVRVGDVFSATQRAGRSWEKNRRNGGRLLFSETVTEFRDSADQLVVTATAVAVRVQSAGADGQAAQ